MSYREKKRARPVTCRLLFPLILVVWALSPGPASAQLLVAPERSNPEKKERLLKERSERLKGRINDIVIKGTFRINPRTVLSYLPFGIGDSLPEDGLEDALRALYSTGNFADITVTIEDRDIIIIVEEYPIIRQIAFEGNKSINDDILAETTRLKPLQTLTPARVKKDIDLITSLYRQRGKLNSEVEAKLIRLDQNRVDLVYEIGEGRKTTIRSISFVGNRHFSDGDLRERLLSREDRFWRFLSGRRNYSSDRVAFESELVRRHYRNNGFADIKASAAIAELTPDFQSFNVTYIIDENIRYKIRNVGIDSLIPGIDVEELEKALEKSRVRTGKWYSADEIATISQTITTLTNRQGFPFADSRIKLIRDRGEEAIDIAFVIEPQKRHYIDRINITGNTITFDHVIRREILFVEGDPLIQSRLNQSRQKLTRTGFFKTVNITSRPGSTPDRAIIDVKVEEAPTGKINLAVGYSNVDGTLVRLGFSESNFRGRGQKVSVSTRTSESTTEARISITEPYFAQRPLRGSISLFSEIEKYDQLAYEKVEGGVSFGLGYRLNERWNQNLFTRISEREIKNVAETASESIKNQEGTVTIAEIGQTISRSTRNSNLFPTEGSLLSLTTTLSEPGSDIHYQKATGRARKYFSLGEKNVLAFRLDAGTVTPINESELRLTERFLIGGRLLRGFRYGGVGPRLLDDDTTLGGLNYGVAGVEIRIPLGLSTQTGLSAFLFYNAGILKGLDPAARTGDYVDSDKVRDATGYGISWLSPIGPFRFEWLQPNRYEEYDEREDFEFSIGTGL